MYISSGKNMESMSHKNILQEDGDDFPIEQVNIQQQENLILENNLSLVSEDHEDSDSEVTIIE